VTTADPPPVQRDTMRLVAFSDAVFAITITLLALEMQPPADYKNLLHDLLALWPSHLAYVVTFLFIGQVWANHHVMFDHGSRRPTCWAAGYYPASAPAPSPPGPRPTPPR
jgi:hypothetical protein